MALFESIDAYVVVYSIADKLTFDYALRVLQEVQKENSRPVLLVGNKHDLVRQRKVSREGMYIVNNPIIVFITCQAV